MTTCPETMSEDQLLERARKAMAKAASLPPGSLGRSIQWGVFDTMMAELERRALRYIPGQHGRGPAARSAR